jgi:hypothetical protein
MEQKKECIHCGKKFTSIHSRAKFCSDYCRVTWNRDQKKDKPKSQKKSAPKKKGGKTVVDTKKKMVPKKIQSEPKKPVSVPATQSNVSLVGLKYSELVTMAKDGKLTREDVKGLKLNDNQKSMLYAKISN